MNKILKVQEKILDLIYPKTCGICGKIDSNSLCKKCEKKLKSQLSIPIIQEVEDKYFDELMCIWRYEGQIRRLLLDYKFNEKTYVYMTFTNFLLKDEKIFENVKNYDTIIPVPISKKRQKQRGYNQSELIAKELAKKTKLEYRNNCLIKTKNIIEQSKLNKEGREKNIHGVYRLENRELLRNKKILLIDDIYTTGSTVNECSKILRKSNPNKIGVLTIAKD